MSLFQLGDFKLASGRTSNFKIECDAFTVEDWATLAELIAERVPPFDSVYGVPRGGQRLAQQLCRHRQPHGRDTLVVDDVWTTGGSWHRFVNGLHLPNPDGVLGAVVFARGPVPNNVTALFQMPVPG